MYYYYYYYYYYYWVTYFLEYGIQGVKICNEILIKLQKITEYLLCFKLMERLWYIRGREGEREAGRIVGAVDSGW